MRVQTYVTGSPIVYLKEDGGKTYPFQIHENSLFAYLGRMGEYASLYTGKVGPYNQRIDK